MSLLFSNLYQRSFEEADNHISYHRQQGDFVAAGEISYEVTDCYFKIRSILTDQTTSDVQENQIKQAVDAFNSRWKAVQVAQLKSPEEQLRHLKEKYPHHIHEMTDYLILSNYLSALDHDQEEAAAIKRNLNISSISFADLADEINYACQTTKKKVQILKSLQKIWKPRKFDATVAKIKMAYNSLKAAIEHRRNVNHIPYVDSFVSPKESLDFIFTETSNEVALPVNSIIFFGEAQGVRTTMEDARFCIEDENRILTGVFDGHGGDAISKSVSLTFLNEFDQVLKQCKGNVHEAFEKVFHETQSMLKTKRKLESYHAGSTAVVCYVDKKTHLVYTATLGDSEANIYRVVDGAMKSICLSTVRDWGSQKDATRIAAYYSSPDIAESWPLHRNPKHLRSGIFSGVNVSRAFGDFQYAGTSKKPLVICKPKITLNKLREGDILMLACDGLKDYVPENAIIKFLEHTSGNVAQHLVNHAIKDWHSKDNVTVVIVKIPHVSPEC